LWRTGGLALPTTRSPPGLSTPAGFSPAAWETPSRPLRSWPSPVSHSLSTRRLAASVSISTRPDDLSPDHLPVRVLRPSLPATRRQRLDGFSSVPSPVPLRDRVHPLMGLTSPSEYVAACHLPDTGMPSAFPGVLSPLRDKSVWSPLNVGSPTPDYVPPSAFLALSAACSSIHRVGLFHPTATSGIRSSGVFPAAKPARLIDESCPHVVTELLLTASCPAAASSTRSAFRALIRAAIRCDRQAV
jgi:hypothetical protein